MDEILYLLLMAGKFKSPTLAGRYDSGWSRKQLLTSISKNM
jgi:hypothetical protein